MFLHSFEENILKDIVSDWERVLLIKNRPKYVILTEPYKIDDL